MCEMMRCHTIFAFPCMGLCYIAVVERFAPVRFLFQALGSMVDNVLPVWKEVIEVLMDKSYEGASWIGCS